MDLFGFLTFKGDLQEIPTRNNQYGNEPFLVRDVCVHYFVVSSQNGRLVPLLRCAALRMTGRDARNFDINEGSMVAVEYSSTGYPFLDKEKGTRRASGNLTISRIVEVTQDDVLSIDHQIASFKDMKA